MNMVAFLQQILILLVVVGVAFFATKKGVLKASDASVFTRLISQVTLPFTMLSAANISLTPVQRESIPLVLVLFSVFYIASLLLGKGLARPLRLAQGEGVVLSCAITFTNGVFIGLPLLEGVFGPVAYLYVAVTSLAFSLIFFTVGIAMMQPGRPFRWKDLLTPLNLSTLLMIAVLLLGVSLPALISKAISTIGAATTPLSLVAIGIMLAGSDFRAMLGKKLLYLNAFLRNLLLPLIMLGVLLLTPLPTDSRLMILILYACPSATLVSVFANQYDLEAQLAGEMIVFSTVVSALTLPLMAWLGQQWL